jgi:hypothetical protein
MNKIVLFILSFVSLFAAIGLVVRAPEHWGWFLFASLIFAGAVFYDDKI